MITSKDCKMAIVELCKLSRAHIESQFVPGTTGNPLTDKEFAETGRVANWKRITKEKYSDGSIERGFDCHPFDDQLRGYVVEKNGCIVSVRIQGE